MDAQTASRDSGEAIHKAIHRLLDWMADRLADRLIEEQQSDVNHPCREDDVDERSGSVPE